MMGWLQIKQNLNELWRMRENFPFVHFLIPSPNQPLCRELSGSAWRITDSTCWEYAPPHGKDCGCSLCGLTPEMQRNSGLAVRRGPVAAPRGESREWRPPGKKWKSDPRVTGPHAAGCALLSMLCALCAFVVVLSPSLATEPDGELVSVVYECTIDGDTIECSDGPDNALYSVRLLGIDCPEPKDCTAAAFRASLFRAEALEGAAAVYLEIDPDDPEDRYKRVLAWVWWEDADGELHQLNQALLDSKNARPYGVTP